MPASLKDLRSRIKSVKGTQQITKAMKLVSAAKFVRAQQNAVNARFYALALSKMAKKLAKHVSGGALHPLIGVPQSKTALVLVISSERGLCGGFNTNISKCAIKAIKDLEGEGFQAEAVCIGKKSFQLLNRWKKLVLMKKEEGAHISESDYTSNPSLLLSGSGLVSITTTFDKPSNTMSEVLSDSFETLYKEGKIGKLVIVYNKFQSAMTQIPTCEVVLPFLTDEKVEASQKSGADDSDDLSAEPLFEPEIEEILSHVFSRALTSRIFQALLESIASEHGSRMTAMDNATRNAKEMERKLQLTYQRARQAAITRELIEIISGAEAL